MTSYQLLVRLFHEQCVVDGGDGNGPSVGVKPNKDVPSDSLQNPSDPDAGYCGHKGKGYQVQVMETYSPDKSQPDLITHVQVEPAHKSDTQTLLPAIEATRKRDMAPSELLADSLYGSDEMWSRPKRRALRWSRRPWARSLHLSAWPTFSLTRMTKSWLVPWVRFHSVSRSAKKGGFIVHFDKARCDAYPRQSDCPVRREKKRTTLRYDAKELRLARRRAKEKTAAFRGSIATGLEPKPPCPTWIALPESSTCGPRRSGVEKNGAAGLKVVGAGVTA
jgi:hypothetical protein